MDKLVLVVLVVLVVVLVLLLLVMFVLHVGNGTDTGGDGCYDGVV